MSNCCDKKVDCSNCKDLNLKQIILDIKCSLSSLNTDISGELCYGYSCSDNSKETAQELSSALLDIEQEYRKQQLGSQSCLSCSDLRKWLEPLRSKIGQTNRPNLKIDKSGFEQWSLNNPQCCDLKTYKIYAKNLCKKLGIECTVESKVCNLALEITRDILNCDLQLMINAYKKACEFELKLKLDKAQCEVELGLIQEKVSCDLTTKEYGWLVNDAGMCFDMVKITYENDCSLETDGDDPILVTALGAYNLNKDIKGKFKTESKLSIKTILDNYK